jgi:TIGR03009 family protein
MHNGMRLLVVSSSLLLAFVETASAQNGPQTQPPRAYSTYAGDQGDVGANHYPDHVPAQQIDPGISPRTDAGRDPNTVHSLLIGPVVPHPDAPPGPGAPQNPPPPPFTLTPQEQAELDQILISWEQKNGQIKTFKCYFDRKQYDPVFMPKQGDGHEEPIQMSRGEIKYEAPDKGLLRETEGEVWSVNPTTRKREKKKLDALEHWACDGKNLYKVDYVQTTVEEIPIPPELQGKGITQGPLPFVFGAKAAVLKARYYIRRFPDAPKDDKDHAWLEIRPKFVRDAQNFSEVDLILRVKDMFPEAVQIHGINGTDRDVYMLAPQGFNLIPNFGSDFTPTPFGFKHIKNNAQAAPAAQAGGANAPRVINQAQRIVPDASRR